MHPGQSIPSHVTPPRLAIAPVAALIAALVAGCKRTPPSTLPSSRADAPKSVALVPVQTRPVDRTIEISGTLYGQEEVTVAAKVAGRVVELLADLGDAAPHGTLLARIDPTDFQLAVDEQRSSLQTALARIGLDALPQGEVDLNSLPIVARARAQADNAKSRLDRARKLYTRTPPLISEQDFADIQTQQEVADTSVSVELLNAASLVADARVKASTLRQAEQRLIDTKVTAPSDIPLLYRVASRRVSVGEIVAPSQPMFRLVASDHVKFRGQVPERFARDLAPNAAAQLLVSAFPKPFEAKVSRISPAVDVQTRSFEVELDAPNPDALLKPGSFATARIHTSTHDDARFVPDTAVLQFAGVQRLFSVRDGKVVEHRVKLGPVVDGQRELLDGPPDVDSFIDKPRNLSSGMPVNTPR